MQKNHKCVIVIPIYKKLKDLLGIELSSIKQILTILGKRQIVFVAPNQLVCTEYEEYAATLNVQVSIIKFEDKFFRSTEGYNELKLKPAFFESFLGYDYLLIAQTDAWVFRDDLDFWCQKDFDYIGAPWLDDKNFQKVIDNNKIWLFKISLFIHKLLGYKTDWRVGNGGFCLHKINSSLQILKNFKKFKFNFEANEDLFWGIYAPLIWPFFRVPNEDLAMKFAFEEKPEVYFELNKRQLPFGCHAWHKYNFRFWQNYIKL